MSLRSKIVLILVTVVVSYAALDNSVQRFLAGETFGRLERDEALEGLGHVRQRIETELDTLSSKARVLARTGDVAALLAGAPGAGASLGALLSHAGADLLYVLAPDGRVRWGSALDSGTREPIRVPEFPREALAPNHVAIRFQPGTPTLSGVMTTRLHPLLFSSVAVADASGRALLEDAEGVRPAAGVIVLGRFLGPELKRRIVADELQLATGEAGTVRRQVSLLAAGAPELPPEFLRGDQERMIRPGKDGLLHAFQRIDSLRTGEPLVLHVAQERSIDAYRRTNVNLTLLSTLIGGTLILFVQLRLLQRFVITPLSALTAKAVEIGRRDDTTIRVGLRRSDEIGQLAGEFDRMLGKLAASREEVVKTARLAGRSEVATGVLHNVGNVLNSVNVAANLATKKSEDLALGDLHALVGVLAQHEHDLAEFVAHDPRGKHFLPFLRELSESLGQQREALQGELRALNQGIEHMAELVRAQQSHAGTKCVLEKAVLAEQVEAALVISGQTLAACEGLEIVREYEPLPSVDVDKHKLMEILVNLIQNAGQSMIEHAAEPRTLTLRIARHGEGTARIEVRDSGHGIAPENLTRVFQHGFTTKKDGHGFGLHVSANAATEMGAKLSADSAGLGRGASFTLDIPMPAEKALAAV
ncbi:MAG TPA: ATP-binding protein [Planctomycetota bacterium]